MQAYRSHHLFSASFGGSSCLLPNIFILQTMNKVVFIREAISEDVANNMIALTLYLDSLDKKRIYYWLNCPGGDVSVLPFVVTLLL
jgi:ATP-dependent protease ClpP protease subunit